MDSWGPTKKELLAACVAMVQASVIRHEDAESDGDIEDIDDEE